jgi:WD40 repeat protein
VVACSLSDDRSRLATASKDGTLIVWDTARWRELARMRASTGGSLSAVALSGDGRYLAAQTALMPEFKVGIWDVSTGETVSTHTAMMPGKVEALVFSPERVWLAGAADGKVHVWLPGVRGPVRCLEGHSDAVTCCAFSPYLVQVVTGCADGTVRIWDTAGWPRSG